MFSFKKTQYYVPPCPKCQSTLTGRFLYLTSINGVEKIVSQRLAHGELVRVIPGMCESSYENAFCEECGCEWHANIEVRRLTDEEMARARVEKGITKEKYISVKDIKKNTKKELKQKRKQRKKELREKRKKEKLIKKSK